METTTDNTPATDESIAESLLLPIETETDDDDDEVSQDGAESDDEADEGDASQAEDDEDGEADQADDDDEEPDDDEQPASKLHTVKVDGKDVQVTLEEALRGYSGQAYIQKGMEANKAAQRQLQEQAQSLQQQNQVVLQLYQQAQQTGFTPAPQEPDPAMVHTDPIAYLEADARYKTQLRQYQIEQHQAQYLHQQNQAQNDANLRQHMQATEEKLLEDMPELRDPKRADAFKVTLRKAVDHYGYTQEEVRSLVQDIRSIKALADAQKWRDLQAGKKAARQPRETPKAVTRPTGKMRQGGKEKRERESLQRARKTQSDADWAATLLE